MSARLPRLLLLLALALAIAGCSWTPGAVTRVDSAPPALQPTPNLPTADSPEEAVRRAVGQSMSVPAGAVQTKTVKNDGASATLEVTAPRAGGADLPATDYWMQCAVLKAQAGWHIAACSPAQVIPR